jgi:sterol desaturase/sphingolipid hydroxylase (fatty acid hydroxylase superfamily)
MRFGMGLINIQGQVQGVVIGLLLIFSILLPNFARNLSSKGVKIRWQSVVAVVVFAAILVLFFVFFFWSRAAVIAKI